MKYVMITHWKNHWNNVPNNRTFYSLKMLKRPLNVKDLRENIFTIFIKLNEKTRRPERAWEGVVYNFRINNVENRIYFEFRLDREILVPEKYRDWTEGWYKEEDTMDIAIFYPPFFYILKLTNDWRMFEEYTYYLLRLIGINEIYRYRKQRGLADGFFVFKNLAVIYDTTLESNFMSKKEQQIQNYCSQLERGRLEFKSISIDISHCRKEVWIITRGYTRKIKKVNSIAVKEVSIDSLINLYLNRLKESINEEELENKLKNI